MMHEGMNGSSYAGMIIKNKLLNIELERQTYGIYSSAITIETLYTSVHKSTMWSSRESASTLSVSGCYFGLGWSSRRFHGTGHFSKQICLLCFHDSGEHNHKMRISKKANPAKKRKQMLGERKQSFSLPRVRAHVGIS